MPIYEYRCNECGKVSSFLVLSIRDPFRPKCKRCQSAEMTKLISRVARVRSEESRLESLADPSKLGDLDEKDPASMARWMKRMGKESEKTWAKISTRWLTEQWRKKAGERTKRPREQKKNYNPFHLQTDLPSGEQRCRKHLSTGSISITPFMAAGSPLF